MDFIPKEQSVQQSDDKIVYNSLLTKCVIIYKLLLFIKESIRLCHSQKQECNKPSDSSFTR